MAARGPIQVLLMLLVVLVSWERAGILAGQVRENPGDTLRLRSDLVRVVVSVMDKRGSPVSGLTKNDFEIFDNDRRRPIVSFQTEPGGSSISRRLSFVLLVDSSGSVAATVGQQRSAAKSLITALGGQTKIAVLGFSGSSRELVGLTSDKQRALDALANLTSVGGPTAILDALLAGFNVLSSDDSPQSQKVVLVLTDGLDTTSRADADGCIHRAAELGATVYGVQIPVYVPVEGRLTPRPPSREWLRVVAATGGKLWRVGTALQAIDPRVKLDLSPVFQELLSELGSQCILGFYPEEHAAPGYHALKVKVKSAIARRVRHRLGYWYNP